jgi:DNA-binding response OmpR family regulator
MKILSLTLDQELSRLRHAILASAGYEVKSLTTEKEALKAVQSTEHFDTVLLCHHLPAATSRATIRLLRQHHPDAQIVLIVHLYGEWPEMEADRYIVGSDGPDALLRVLREVHA